MEQLAIAVKQFARLLRSGGALVCDERNFDYIVENWDTIHPDPWNQFRFNQRPAQDRVMYYGDTVLGAPVKRSEKGTDKGRITFLYSKVERDEEGRITPATDGELGTLSMYPFAKGALLKALHDTHSFASIDMYSDLVKTTDLEGKADFYTYVAWKA
jgi:hypothetical protein